MRGRFGHQEFRALIIYRFLMIVSLLTISPSTLGEICRWTVSNGTVPYADECPEGVEGADVMLDPQPPTEQVKTAEDRARQLQLAKQARKEAQTESIQQLADEDAVEAKICIDAKLALDTLEMALPVYLDETGVLHHNRSWHSETYQGNRHYLDENERKQEIARSRNLIDQHCGESKSDYIRQSDELKSRITEVKCANYEAEAERMIRSRASGSADRARELIRYCESDKDRL